MEVLQVLKFHCRRNRLTLRHTENLAAKEEDYTIVGPVSTAAARELVAEGRYDELKELLANVQ